MHIGHGAVVVVPPVAVYMHDAATRIRMAPMRTVGIPMTACQRGTERVRAAATISRTFFIMTSKMCLPDYYSRGAGVLLRGIMQPIRLFWVIQGERNHKGNCG